MEEEEEQESSSAAGFKISSQWSMCSIYTFVYMNIKIQKEQCY